MIINPLFKPRRSSRILRPHQSGPEWRWFWDGAADIMLFDDPSQIPREFLKNEVLSESGGPTWETGIRGQAREYITAHDALASGAARNLRDQMTIFIGGMTTKAAADSTTQTLIAKREATGDATNYALTMINSSSNGNWYWAGVGGFQSHAYTHHIRPNEFFQIAATRIPGGTGIGGVWVNGARSLGPTSGDDVVDDDANVGTTIGRLINPAEDFQGHIYYVYILDKEATEGQVKQLQADPYGPFRVSAPLYPMGGSNRVGFAASINSVSAVAPTVFAGVFPLLRGMANASSGSNVTNHTINFPAGIVVGDLLTAFTNSDANVGNTNVKPDGWEELFNHSSFNVHSTAFWWKIADADDVSAGSATWTTTSNQETVTHCRAYIKDTFEASAPINASGTNASSGSTPTANAITTTKDDCVTIACIGAQGPSRLASATVPAGHQLDFNIEASGSASHACAGMSWSSKKEVAGDIGSSASQLDSSRQWRAYTIAITPDLGLALMAGSVDSVSSVSVAAGVTRGFSASVDSTSSVSATMNRTAGLASVVASVSTVNAAILTKIPFAAVVPSVSAVTGVLTVEETLFSAVSASQSSAAASVDMQRGMVAAVPSVSGVSVSITGSVSLASVVASVSAVNVQLAVEGPLGNPVDYTTVVAVS